MTAARLATVAAMLLSVLSYQETAQAQVLFSTGTGVCRVCGHSEIDTQRYINSFLNQLFFPESAISRTAVAASLYLFTATYTMYGNRSPDPRYSSVTIAITAEVKNAIPTGRYHVTATTPAGKTLNETYAIGKERFSITDSYAPGAVRTRTGPKGGGGRQTPPGFLLRPNDNRPAACSRSRVVKRGNETILYCSRS